MEWFSLLVSNFFFFLEACNWKEKRIGQEDMKQMKINILFNIDHLTINYVEKYMFEYL